MMCPADHSEFEQLVSTACERPLTTEEFRLLESLLAENPEARREWLDACRLHVELGLHMRADAISRRISDRIASGAAEEAAPEATYETATLASCPAAAPSRMRRGYYAAMAAALVGIAASLVFVATPPRSTDLAAAAASDQAAPRRLPKRRPEVVALTRQTDSQGLDVERVLLAGEELSVGSGRTHLEMTGGARLSIEGPARLKLLAPDHVRLMKGSLSAQLAEWATGFIVDTKAMRLVDLGTTFAVTAESATVAEAQVLQGLVKVQPREQTDLSLRSFLLGEGEAVRIEGDRTIRGSVELDSDAVRRHMAELGRLGSYQRIASYNTGVALHEGEEDPHWRITRASEGTGVSTPRYAVVCKPHFRYSINEPMRSQWVSVSHGNEPLPPETIYTFSTSIDLTGYDLRSVRLIGQILADNGVREIRLNGVRVDCEGWNDNVWQQEFRREEFHVVEINDGFRPGENTLEFDVWNGGEYRNPDGNVELKQVPNPMALRVEWQAFGQPTESG